MTALSWQVPDTTYGNSVTTAQSKAHNVDLTADTRRAHREHNGDSCEPVRRGRDGWGRQADSWLQQIGARTPALFNQAKGLPDIYGVRGCGQKLPPQIICEEILHGVCVAGGNGGQ